MDLKDQVEQADIRLRPHVVQTAVKQAPWLGNDVQLKLENQQHTGSFKARGALNRLLQTDQTSPSRGLVAASTGNHALAVNMQPDGGRWSLKNLPPFLGLRLKN